MAKPVEEGKSTKLAVETSLTPVGVPQGGTTMALTMRATYDLIKRLVEVSSYTTCIAFLFCI